MRGGEPSLDEIRSSQNVEQQATLALHRVRQASLRLEGLKRTRFADYWRSSVWLFVGKTFIAQATGLHACACGKSVLYMTVTTWLENLALARTSGTYLRYRDKLARPDVLILDDMGMRKLSSTEAQDLCEILEERSIGKSTMFTTQIPWITGRR